MWNKLFISSSYTKEGVFIKTDKGIFSLSLEEFNEVALPLYRILKGIFKRKGLNILVKHEELLSVKEIKEIVIFYDGEIKKVTPRKESNLQDILLCEEMSDEDFEDYLQEELQSTFGDALPASTNLSVTSSNNLLTMDLALAKYKMDKGVEPTDAIKEALINKAKEYEGRLDDNSAYELVREIFEDDLLTTNDLTETFRETLKRRNKAFMLDMIEKYNNLGEASLTEDLKRTLLDQTDKLSEEEGVELTLNSAYEMVEAVARTLPNYYSEAQIAAKNLVTMKQALLDKESSLNVSFEENFKALCYEEVEKTEELLATSIAKEIVEGQLVIYDRTYLINSACLENVLEYNIHIMKKAIEEERRVVSSEVKRSLTSWVGGFESSYLLTLPYAKAVLEKAMRGFDLTQNILD